MSTIIGNHDIMKVLRAKIQANSTITSELASVNEVREAEYQGRSFSYPAIRIDVQRQTPGVVNTEKCVVNQAFWVIRVYDENDSSSNCDRIASIVANQLDRGYVSDETLLINRMYLNGLMGARQVAEKLWMAELIFTGNVYAR
jgi:hypothetical protein